MTHLIQAGLLPSLLVVLVGILISYTEPDHRAGRRFQRYLWTTGALLAVAVVVASLFAALLDSRAAYLVLRQITPALIGMLALVLLRVKWLARLKRGTKVASILLLLILSLVLTYLSAWGQAFAILPDALLLAALWALVDRFESGTKLALTSLALLVFYGVVLAILNAALPSDWLRLPFGLALFLLPKLAVALAAALILGGFRRLPLVQGDSPPQEGRTRRFPIAWRWGLAIILLGMLAYVTVWSSIWDQTSDGLGGVFLSTWAGAIAIAAGTLMGFTLTRWRRTAGLVFAMMVPLLVSGAFKYGWSISYHDLTESRAARIQHAIECFHDRNGHYPEKLGELVPRDLLWIPGPAIVQGRGWCYQGTGDGYRLGTFYREYWSMPFSLRIYASAGSTPASEWACEQELAALKAQRDPPPMYEQSISPTAEPLPTSIISIPRTPVQPLLTAQSISVGDWSPDSRYLFLGSLDTSGAAPSTTLGFLDATNGTVCPAASMPPVMGLRDRHAWLPDGRLLFFADEGEMDLLTPCEDRGVERLSDRYPVMFNQLLAHDDQNNRMLLRSEQSFWILDGHSLEVQQVAEVTPNPYERHWDDAAWSLDGEWLAISRLNGRTKREGSTLYLIAGDSGEVARQLPLGYASDQHAPGVEWLSEDELLLHGENALLVLDVRSGPPTVSNVLQDTFNLDVIFPYETAALAWIVHADASYHLAVWVNHPRNQGLYLYHSETKSIDVLHPEVHTVLFFSDGQWEGLLKTEETPTYLDEYDLVWVDEPHDPWRLVVQGHTPRHYPHLFPRYLQSEQMVFASSQGISLVSIPDGELLHFWELRGTNDTAHVRPAPDEKALVAVAGEKALYWIPLQHQTAGGDGR